MSQLAHMMPHRFPAGSLKVLSAPEMNCADKEQHHPATQTYRHIVAGKTDMKRVADLLSVRRGI